MIPFEDSFLSWVRSPHQVTAIWKRNASLPKAFQLVLRDELEVPLHVYMLQWDACNEHFQSLVTEARFLSTASYFCMKKP
jgi:ATP:corrinoid adenosyltransferase